MTDKDDGTKRRRVVSTPERSAVTDRIAREIVALERAAREEKTKRLRAARLAREAGDRPSP